jgi:hypothetical protein
MGYYIQGPILGKATFIQKEYGALPIEQPKSFFEVTEGKALICIVNNGFFDAAAYIYDVREFTEFTDSYDDRPKIWLLMDANKAKELTDFKG